MKSKVLNCIALLSDSEVCFCRLDKYKTCAKRINGNLDCCECIVRITPVDRDQDEVEDSVSLSVAKSLANKEIEKQVDNFKRLLDHMDRMK